MNRMLGFFVIALFVLLDCEEKKSPYIPFSYDLLPQSDLPIIGSNWHQCSIPVGKDLASQGKLIWFNPWEQVAIPTIWPAYQVTPEVPNRTHVLSFDFSPTADLATATDSWNGVMMQLSGEFKNQLAGFRYLELTIKGDIGKIHFDIGNISEDAIPNGKLNTEDQLINGIRNSRLDAGENIGLDTMAGVDPNDWWDLNGNGIKDAGEPISYDDYYYQSGSFHYQHINGTEGNPDFIDTEDLDGDGTLDLQNDYLEYTLDLNKASADTALIQPSFPTNESRGWYTYRLDLTQPSAIIGTVNPWQLDFVRIWMDGFTRPGNITIATFDFK